MANRARIILLSFILLAAAIIIGVSSGPVKLGFRELFSYENHQILRLRAARVFLGLVAGGGLAVAGVIFQGILRNPLAEPYVLGISSGAGLGAVMSLFFGLSIRFLPLMAFLGAGLAMLLVYNLARINSRVSVHGLLLSGVIVGAVFASLLLFFVSISADEAMHSITWWLLGSLQIFDIGLLLGVSSIIILGGCVAIYYARDLNAISLGEEEAEHLGINVEAVKTVLFIVASLITGGIVCICGIIGFVGLIIPHAVRLIFGSDHRIVIPLSAIVAGVFLVVADIISRIAMPPIEVPIGVITALIGGPFFIILLRRKQKQNI